jgi:D-serine deaminase-like pyridoxal phosphate-dependent protein
LAEGAPSNRGRRLFLGAAVAATVGAVAWQRPAEHGGGGHDEYFAKLQAALKRAGLNRPTLVIDRARLDHNIGRLKEHLPKNKHYRVVAKSLPSLDLMRYVRTATATDRLMVFDQPFLNFVALQMPDAKVLMGKPMPVGAAKRFFDRLDPAGAEVAKHTEWLVDTRERLAQYAELARAHVANGGAPLRVNLELDVGLHRGGIRSTDTLGEILKALIAEPALAFSGFMGYEAHAS